MNKIKIILYITISYFVFGNYLVFAAVGDKELAQATDNLSFMSSFFSTTFFLNLGFAVVTLIATLGIARFISGRITHYFERTTEEGSNKDELIGVLTRTSNITVYAIGFSIILGILGVDTGIFMGGIGFGLGFTLKIFLTNFISGVMMVTQGFYHSGDIIEISGKVGRIKKINSLFTSIVQFNGIIFFVPNVKFLEENVSNYNSNDKRRVEIDVGVDYDTDILKAKKIILGVLSNFPQIFQAPEPKIFVENFGDSSIGLGVRFWISSTTGKYFETKSNVIETINLAFKTNGIVIPFPQVTLSNRNNFKIKQEK